MNHPQRRTAVRVLSVVTALGLVSGLAACSATGSTAPSTSVDPNAAEVNPAGDIPDNQVFVVWTDPSSTFSVKVPEGWASSTDNGAVTFTDKLNSIRIESAQTSTAPTAASVRGEVAAFGQSASGFQAGDVTTVTRTAGDAVLATYQVDSAPDSVTGKVVPDAVERYEFYRNGTLVTLTLSGPVGADNVDPWRLVTDSLTWL